MASYLQELMNRTNRSGGSCRLLASVDSLNGPLCGCRDDLGDHERRPQHHRALPRSRPAGAARPTTHACLLLLLLLLLQLPILRLQGVLKGYDQCINVVLDDSFERVYSAKEPVEAVELGLYIVRGDNMCVTLVLLKTLLPLL